MKRTIYKAVSWMIITTTLNIVLVYAFTRRVDVSLLIGGINIVVKFTGYFIHERIWKKIKL